MRRMFHVGDGWALYDGPASDNTPHAHHALQACLSRDTEVAVELNEHTYWGSSVIIRSGFQHALRADSGLVRVLYLDPHGEPAHVLERACGGDGVAKPASAVENALRKCIERTMKRDASGQFLIGDVRAILGSPFKAPNNDERADQVLAILRRDLAFPPPLAPLARTFGLSPHRLSDIVTAETGLPLRGHIRWLRMQAAVHALTRRSDSDSVAREVGFRNGAYLTNCFRQMFGASPSELMPSVVRRASQRTKARS